MDAGHERLGPGAFHQVARRAREHRLDDVVVGAEEAGGAEDELVASLSERELSMLRTLARGLSNKAIGDELWITEQTVKFHLTNIYRKLGVENRTQATRVAYEHHLV